LRIEMTIRAGQRDFGGEGREILREEEQADGRPEINTRDWTLASILIVYDPANRARVRATAVI
jgi:hypothetical protein